MNPAPLIIYVPGLLPKPPADAHRDALLRCLLAGIKTRDDAIAGEIEARPASFEIVSWTYDFYGEHREFALDSPSVDALLAQGEIADRDIQEATSPTRRFTRWLFTLADKLPVLIPHVATERVRLHMRDVIVMFCVNDVLFNDQVWKPSRCAVPMSACDVLWNQLLRHTWS
jgi:hypothetical protein